MIVLNVNKSQFENSLHDYVRLLKMDSKEVVSNQHRLLLQQIIKLLPPKSKSQGGKAVERDLRRAASPLDPAKFKKPTVRRLIENEDTEALQKIADNSNRLRGKRVEKFNPDLHKNARNRRGQVRRSKNRIVPGVRDWRKHLNSKKKKVGMLKAGFAIGMVRLGSPVPKWIRNNMNMGRFIDMRQSRRNPRLISVNTVDFIDQYSRSILRAASNRERAMDKDIRLRLKRNAMRTGLI